MSPDTASGVLSDALVGASAGPLTQAIDARWLMAYAAGLAEDAPRYFDTGRPDGPQAHPVFPVCYEWPVAVELRERAIDGAIAPLSVHATHRLIIHRPPRSGDRLTTSARIVEVRGRPAGALVVTRFDTTDADGRPVTTTFYGSVYRGVSVRASARDGRREATEPRRRPTEAPEATGTVRWEAPLSVSAQAAHVYTECARIWNPIHTDVVVARAAGLPGPILHGTATLALAVSGVVARDLAGEVAGIREIGVRFSGMVQPASTFTVRGRTRTADSLSFDAVGADGRPILSQGALILCSR